MSRDEELEWPACVAQRIRDQADRVEYRVGGLIVRVEALTAERDAQNQAQKAQDEIDAAHVVRIFDNEVKP